MPSRLGHRDYTPPKACHPLAVSDRDLFVIDMFGLFLDVHKGFTSHRDLIVLADAFLHFAMLADFHHFFYEVHGASISLYL